MPLLGEGWEETSLLQDLLREPPFIEKHGIGPGRGWLDPLPLWALLGSQQELHHCLSCHGLLALFWAGGVADVCRWLGWGCRGVREEVGL